MVVEKVICISKPYIGEYTNGCFYNLVRTMDTIKFKLNNILFIGPNPDIFIQYLPQRKQILFNFI